MILLIPLALWLSTVICYLAIYKDVGQSFRRSLLGAAIGVFFFIAGITEVLGAVNLISRPAVTGSWIILDLILLLAYFKVKKKYGMSMWQAGRAWLLSAKVFVRELGVFTSIILVLLFSITLTVALVAPPNNLDSLSYHLSRLGYWIQNKNVAHYATHIERSISFSPLSEYVHLHTFLLSLSERYFQLLQWLCLVGILGFISLLTGLFSGSRRALQIALCFASTLPIAVLESMTTQNDLVAAFFVMTTAFFVFDYVKTQNKITLIFIGLSVALGMMTKGTFAFFVLPFGLYLFVFMVSKKVWLKPLIGLALGTIVIVILLNAPFWYRTYQVFGSPIGRVSNGNKTKFENPAGFVSSVSKHVFLHLGFVSPGNKYNIFMEKQLQNLHNAIDTPINGPGNGMEFKMNKLNFNEDFAHNFLAMWLVLFCIPLLFFARLSRAIKWYAVLALASFMIFCFFIAYQTYGSRLHISFFMLVAPVVGLVYGSVLSAFFSRILIFLLWLSALPFALLSNSHPLLSTKWFFEEVFPAINSALHLNINIGGNLNLKQESVLFSSPEKVIWGDLWPETEKLINEINLRNPRKIGLDLEEFSYDYAYQYSLRKPGRVFEHVLVRNPSKKLEKREFRPDLIISEHYEGEKFSYHNQVYVAEPSGTGRWLYIPDKNYKTK